MKEGIRIFLEENDNGEVNCYVMITSDDDIEAYSDIVTCFIRKCIEDVVPTKTAKQD